MPSDGIITQSLNLNGGFATRSATDQQAAYTISTDNLTLDFGNAILRSGTEPTTGLESKTGTGILIKNCKNVTLENLRIRGYRWNITLQNCQNVTLKNVDASYSRAELMVQNNQPVNSFLDLRNVDSWRTYGSGFWIENCQSCTVDSCDASDAQNGIILVDSQNCRLINNTCMFNSGWGIAMWNSALSHVLWNHLDFCNRRWGSGWGGDSAALALANNCHENILLGNSMTHSGDGFFLSDRVNGGFNDKDQTFHFDGGSNDNIIAESDGSYSTANAFEDTFSDRNIFYKDRANSSRYGFWIGFSNDTFIGNCSIQSNEVDGIAGGQGARARIENNDFANNGGFDGNFWSDPGPAQVQKPSADIEVGLKNPFDPARWSFKNSSAKIYAADQSTPTLIGSPTEQTPRFGSSGRIIERIQPLLDADETAKPAQWKFYAETELPQSNQWLTISTYGPFDFRGQLAAIHKSPDSLSLKPLHPGTRIEIPNDFVFGDSEDPTQTTVQPGPVTGPLSRYLPYSVQILDAQTHQTQSVSGVFTTQTWQCAWFPGRAIPEFLSNGTAQPYGQFKTVLAGRPSFSSLTRNLSPDPPSGDAPQGPAGQFILIAKSGFVVPTGSLQFQISSNIPYQLFVDGKEVMRQPASGGFPSDSGQIKLISGTHWVVIAASRNQPGQKLKFRWNFTPDLPNS